jgi:hypothetical protein
MFRLVRAQGREEGSMEHISKGRMDGWSLLVKGLGLRSWVLVVLIIY